MEPWRKQVAPIFDRVLFPFFLADDVLEPCVWVWVSVSLEEANGSYSFGELLMWVLGFIFYLIFIALRRSLNNYIYNEGGNYIKLNKTLKKD